MLYALNAGTGALVWSTNVGAAILPPDEQNISQPLTGLGAGQDLLVVPAGNTVSAFFNPTPPAAPSTPIPTLSEWAFVALIALLLLFALGAIRRNR
jgi:hypothetical protein